MYTARELYRYAYRQVRLANRHVGYWIDSDPAPYIPYYGAALRSFEAKGNVHVLTPSRKAL